MCNVLVVPVSSHCLGMLTTVSGDEGRKRSGAARRHAQTAISRSKYDRRIGEEKVFVGLTPIMLRRKIKDSVARSLPPLQQVRNGVRREEVTIVFGDRLQESLHNIPSLHLLQKSIDRTPNPAPAAPQDVCVNHGRSNVRMPQQLLNRPNIVSVLDKMRRK
jgi:hypothetical protein